jgi:hypothetical protein
MIWKSQYTVTSGANSGDTINAVAIVTEQGDFFTAAKNANNGCASVGLGQGSVSGTTASGTAGMVRTPNVRCQTVNLIPPMTGFGPLTAAALSSVLADSLDEPFSHRTLLARELIHRGAQVRTQLSSRIGNKADVAELLEGVTVVLKDCR